MSEERKKALAEIPDQAARVAAVTERGRNVIVDAGAGTGKTTLLVRRIVERVAPASDADPALSMSRICAVTFTRKAAGELRLRIREMLLAAMGDPRLSGLRRERLHTALSVLDTAYVGTIHSITDRLLRSHPVEAGLSPDYDIVEGQEESLLLEDSFSAILEAAQAGRLGDLVVGTAAEPLAEEVTETVLVALRAGIPAESRDRPWGGTAHGLDRLFAAFVRRRDVPPDPLPDLEELDLESFRTCAQEFIDLIPDDLEPSLGGTWLRSCKATLEGLLDETDAAALYREVVLGITQPAYPVSLSRTFDHDKEGWEVWKIFDRGFGRDGRPLRDDLFAPLQRWLGVRLVRTYPVAVAVYESIKRARGKVDQIDLLLAVRNLLQTQKPVRAAIQDRFDHILVDEFQDTDPLQAEIILYLAEDGAIADRFDEVRLAAGKLSIVGDPKQSIYRFRRADIEMYDEVRRMIADQGAAEVEITTNFRSAPELIEWANDRFETILGPRPEGGQRFDPDTGAVFHQPLDADPRRSESGTPHVHVVPYEIEDENKVGPLRALEGQVLATYLRWLVDIARPKITDPLSGATRPIGFGDIAVLAVSTSTLSCLFPWMDALGIPYSSRGGTLFLGDPLSQRFLLGLRALADRSDGIAEAVLLRPPFFALDPSDILARRFDPGVADPERLARIEAARARIQTLRRERFSRSPGATARDLLETTCIGRVVALGDNGAQRLARLRELCLLLEQTAAAAHLDYDGATEALRAWVGAPIQLDPPHPVGSQAVQILTVHQAKGLEFPVVALWDGCAKLDATVMDLGAWSVADKGKAWRLGIEGLACEHPPDHELRSIELAYQTAERHRVVYVAATRARDLLVLPCPGRNDAISTALVGGADRRWVQTAKTWAAGKLPFWAKKVRRPPAAAAVSGGTLDHDLAEQWAEALASASQPRYQPIGVARAAALSVEPDEDTPIDFPIKRRGRYGPIFGDTVHAAIGIVLAHPNSAPAEAVAIAARKHGLADHLREAAEDVARAVATLEALGLRRQPGPDLRLEYPVVGVGDTGQLLVGSIDLCAIHNDTLYVLDFKTDRPPGDDPEAELPAYFAQVRTYGRLLAEGGVETARARRCGLLFAADGLVRWAKE